MSAPSYLCPFKNDNAGAGITCENEACGAYNFRKEECNIILYYRKGVLDRGVPNRKAKDDGVTYYSSSSSSSSSSSLSLSSSSSSSSLSSSSSSSKSVSSSSSSAK